MNTSTTNEPAWRTCMEAGRQAFQQGRMDEAQRAFKQATTILPERLEGWVNLGSALLEAGHFNAAARALRTANEVNPNIMVCHMLLGDALRMTGYQADALASYEKAVSLQRSPMALNKLACALRTRHRVDEAEELYLEALRLEPNFSLARVNRATLQIERRRYGEADSQLRTLQQAKLPPMERQEVESSLSSLSEYGRLHEAIATMVNSSDLGPLQARLSETPAEKLDVDREAMRTVEAYLESALTMSAPAAPDAVTLHADWPLIEAMHMIPYVHSVDEYRTVIAKLENSPAPNGELLESLNMEAAIRAARNSREDLADPLKAELHLRHWHALACNSVDGLNPGHFKYTQNWSDRNPALKRADPAMTSGTMRYVVSDIYNKLEPGLLRAVVVMLAVLDPHPFADGNGRVAVTWLNRELEWAGLMPALFSTELGFRGKLAQANKAVRNNGGVLTPVLEVVLEAQEYARAFCLELAERDTPSG